MKKYLLMFVCLIIIITLTSCGKVVINLNGGTVDSSINVENSKFKEIIKTTPTKEGYVFAGWYADSNYSDYINPNAPSKQQVRNGEAYAKWIDIPESTSYNVRTETATITDSGRSNQKMDIVYLSNDYDLVDLQRAGYTSFTVKVTLTVREEDDGYQYVFLYKNTYCQSQNLSDWVDENIFGEQKSDPNLLYTYEFESNSSWKTYSFTAKVNLASLEDNLYIRYGASGKYDDTWKNKDILVTVTPNK